MGIFETLEILKRKPGNTIRLYAAVRYMPCVNQMNSIKDSCIRDIGVLVA
jgi:hypothetical protein